MLLDYSSGNGILYSGLDLDMFILSNPLIAFLGDCLVCTACYSSCFFLILSFQHDADMFYKPKKAVAERKDKAQPQHLRWLCLLFSFSFGVLYKSRSY